MNKKKTNRLVAVLNFLLIISTFIYVFAEIFVYSKYRISSTNNKVFIIEFLLNNIDTIHFLMFSAIGIFNIVCAIQNRQDKNIYFWFLVFALSCISSAMSLPDIISQKILSIVLIILAIINIILIKRDRNKEIQFLPYICVIILAILNFFRKIDVFWPIIAIVMQIIHIRHQENNIEETNSKRIINFILYYILQFIIVIGFLGMLIISILI